MQKLLMVVPQEISTEDILRQNETIKWYKKYLWYCVCWITTSLCTKTHIQPWYQLDTWILGPYVVKQAWSQSVVRSPGPFAPTVQSLPCHLEVKRRKPLCEISRSPIGHSLWVTAVHISVTIFPMLVNIVRNSWELFCGYGGVIVASLFAEKS